MKPSAAPTRRLIAHARIGLLMFVAVVMLVVARDLTECLRVSNVAWHAKGALIARCEIVSTSDGAWLLQRFGGSPESGLAQSPYAWFFRAAFRSLAFAVAVSTVATVFGAVLGVVAAFVSPRVDRNLVHGMELASFFPPLAVSLLVLAIVPSASSLELGIGLVCVGWLDAARSIRHEASHRLREPYAIGAHALGSTRRSILQRHVGPGLLGHALSSFFYGLGMVLALDLSLGILGFQNALGPTVGVLAQVLLRGGMHGPLFLLVGTMGVVLWSLHALFMGVVPWMDRAHTASSVGPEDEREDGDVPPSVVQAGR